MSKSLAVAISVGVVAGLWTFLGGDSGALSSLVKTTLPIGFIAWACSGLVGKSDAMQKTVIGMTFGAIIAAVALFVGSYDLPVIGANSAIGVGIAAIILVLIADNVSQVSNVAVNVLGFASAFTVPASNAMDLSNPVAIVLVSSILGVVAGNLAGRLAAAVK